MRNKICWVCENNLSYNEYKGDKLIDDDGSKPCFECLLESGAFDEEEEEDTT